MGRNNNNRTLEMEGEAIGKIRSGTRGGGVLRSPSVPSPPPRGVGAGGELLLPHLDVRQARPRHPGPRRRRPGWRCGGFPPLSSVSADPWGPGSIRGGQILARPGKGLSTPRGCGHFGEGITLKM